MLIAQYTTWGDRGAESEDRARRCGQGAATRERGDGGAAREGLEREPLSVLQELVAFHHQIVVRLQSAITRAARPARRCFCESENGSP